MIFILYQQIHTLLKYSYFMIFILYQQIHTLLKYSYFTENFVLYQKIRTPDEQVLGSVKEAVKVLSTVCDCNRKCCCQRLLKKFARLDTEPDDTVKALKEGSLEKDKV